jgi:hypothetical protein
MIGRETYKDTSVTATGWSMIVALAAIATMTPWAAFGQSGSESAASTVASSVPTTHTHMSDELRSSVKKIAVIAGASPANEEITGSYEEITPGFSAGASEGSQLGTLSTEIGNVSVNFPVSILTIPGAIYGGLSGQAKREIQEFRDALTEDLAKANQPLINDRLAQDVYQSLQSVPGLDSKLFAATTPVPNDVDAILYVSVKEVTIDVQGKEAILTSTVEAVLHRLSDKTNLYRRVVQYQDRDTLANWTENDNALWHDYANFARHYFGREISAEVFDRVELRHELQPKKSDTVALVRKNEWNGVSRSTTPTLAWDLKLLGGDSYGSWADEIDDSDIYYDLEIYDMHRPVYAERQIQGSFHKLLVDIDACKTYRWSVRPSYHVDGDIKFGEWMRIDPEESNGSVNGIAGRKASDAPAYSQDFATLKIACGRR